MTRKNQIEKYVTSTNALFYNLYTISFTCRSFSYLGTNVNGNNTLEEEIRERIVKGNKAFYANKTLFKSNSVSRKFKLKLYWSVFRPIVVYGCETWVLKESIIQKLSVFERKILRKIFGPTEEANGIWRIKTNKELDELIKLTYLLHGAEFCLRR